MGVNKVDLSTGETLIDISNDTVTPETLAEGETAHNAQGEQIVGRMTTEGGTLVSDVLWVTADLNLGTMTAINFSHTYDEIVSAIQKGKVVSLKCNVGFAYTFGQLASHTVSGILIFQLMAPTDLGDGLKLYYFSLFLNQNNTTTLMPYIINTTSIGG